MELSPAGHSLAGLKGKGSNLPRVSPTLQPWGCPGSLRIYVLASLVLPSQALAQSPTCPLLGSQGIAVQAAGPWRGRVWRESRLLAVVAMAKWWALLLLWASSGPGPSVPEPGKGVGALEDRDWAFVPSCCPHPGPGKPAGAGLGAGP